MKKKEWIKYYREELDVIYNILLKYQGNGLLYGLTYDYFTDFAFKFSSGRIVE